MIEQTGDVKILATSRATKQVGKENILYTDGVHDHLQDANGNQAVFDIRQSVRTAIKKYFDQGFKFYYNEAYGFSLRNPRLSKTIISLSQIIAAKKYRKNLNTTYQSKVKFLDGNKLNLVDKNIELCSAAVANENQVNRFYSIEKLFVIEHKETRKTFYTDRNEELEAIIKSMRWYVSNGRLVGKHPRHSNMIQFSHLVYCFYHLGLTKSVFKRALNKLHRLLAVKMECDHFDGNPRNNTKTNLSIMERSTNRKKHGLTKKIKPPFVYYGIYYQGKWRVMLGYVSDSSDNHSPPYINGFIFDDEKELLSTLQDFYYHGFTINQKREWGWFDGANKTPKQHYQSLTPREKRSTLSTQYAAHLTQLLIDRPESGFTRMKLCLVRLVAPQQEIA